MNPKVSICIPNYNYGSYICEAIQSVLDQTYKNFELIIVDNCSTDNSESIIKSFSDNRIKFFENKKNIGFVNNLNMCVSLAKGEYICILHSDDKLVPESIEKRVQVMDKNPNVGLVFSAIKIMNCTGDVIGEIVPFEKSQIMHGDEIFTRILLSGNFIMAPSVMVRSKCYADLGGYNNEIPNPSDVDMWLRISLCYDIAFIRESLAFYRIHGINMTDKARIQGIWGIEMYKMVKILFSQIPKNKKYLLKLEPYAIKELGKREFGAAISLLSDGNSELARKNLASALLINPSYFSNPKIYLFIILTYLGKIGFRISKYLEEIIAQKT